VAQLTANWDRERAQLEALIDSVAQVAANTETKLENWGYAEKRTALLSLKADVTVYPPGRTPRADLTIRLPLRGRVTLNDIMSSCDAQFQDYIG
jgi:hypothetical protein